MSNTVSNFPPAQAKRRAEKSETLALNTKALNQLRNLPPVNSKDISQIRERLNQYFSFCEQNNIFPSVSSMALSLGISRKTLWSWSNDNTELGNLISNAKEVINALLEQFGADGTISPIYTIWLQKNHFNYADTVDIRARQDSHYETALPSKEDILASLPYVDTENAD